MSKTIVMTGGHHSSALPVIELINKAHLDIKVVWFGHKYSLKGDKNETLEYKEITALNIPFYELQAGKVYKTFDPVRLARVPFGFFQALYLLVKLKPDLVMSFGGYLAVPTVIAGWLLGIPSITHEQTSVVGYANKVIGTFARKILISWENSAKFFDSTKVVFSGLPLRKEIFSVNSNAFESKNGLPTIYITAGKTGSVTINNVIKKCLPDLLGFCNVIHQTGDHSQYRSYDELESIYSNLNPKPLGNYFLRKFVFSSEIGEAMNNSMLVVARAGAHTCMELLALNKPCLLIPIPWVSHNEQNVNAQNLFKQGISEVLDDKDLTPNILVEKIKHMLLNITDYKKSTSAVKVSLNAPEEIIVREILECLK